MKLKYVKLWENFDNKIELLDVSKLEKIEAQKLIKDNYSDNLTYKGHDFFNDVYMSVIYNVASKELKIGEKTDIEEEFYDSDADEYYTETISGQESYLGYLPQEDIFISGWDMFDDKVNTVYIKVDENLNGVVIDYNFYGYGFFYDINQYGDNKSVYDKLHEKYLNLLDIRLD